MLNALYFINEPQKLLIFFASEWTWMPNNAITVLATWVFYKYLSKNEIFTAATAPGILPFPDKFLVFTVGPVRDWQSEDFKYTR